MNVPSHWQHLVVRFLMRLVDIDGGTGGLFVAFHKFLIFFLVSGVNSLMSGRYDDFKT